MKKVLLIIGLALAVMAMSCSKVDQNDVQAFSTQETLILQVNLEDLNEDDAISVQNVEHPSEFVKWTFKDLQKGTNMLYFNTMYKSGTLELKSHNSDGKVGSLDVAKFNIE